MSDAAPDAVDRIRRALDIYNTTEAMRQDGKLTSDAPTNVTALIMQVLLANTPDLLARYDTLEAENRRLKQQLDACCK